MQTHHRNRRLQSVVIHLTKEFERVTTMMRRGAKQRASHKITEKTREERAGVRSKSTMPTVLPTATGNPLISTLTTTELATMQSLSTTANGRKQASSTHRIAPTTTTQRVMARSKRRKKKVQSKPSVYCRNEKFLATKMRSACETCATGHTHPTYQRRGCKRILICSSPRHLKKESGRTGLIRSSLRYQRAYMKGISPFGISRYKHSGNTGWLASVRSIVIMIKSWKYQAQGILPFGIPRYKFVTETGVA